MNAMTTPPNGRVRTLSSFVRSTPPDRRTFQRYDGNGLVAMIDGQQVEVRDFSLGGMRLEISNLPVGSYLDILLVPRLGMALQSEQAVKTKVQVKDQSETHARLTFCQVTFTLAKILVQQMARQNGLTPFIFR